MNRLLPAALAALLLPLAALAADEDSLVEVFAVGSGLTQEAAMKAANKAAIEQVVGTMVDATTRIENDELVEDRILTYSAALIADSKIVGEPKKSADGLITVKVRATVERTALKEKLAAARIVSVELDGESLWAQAISAQDNLAAAEAMIKDVLAKHLACVIVEQVPGKNGKSPIDYDPKTGEVFANVRVRIDQAKYRQFVKEVLEKLRPMAPTESSVEMDDTDQSMRFKIGHEDRSFGIVVFDNPKTGVGTLLCFEESLWDAIQNSLQTGSIAIRASLASSTGDELAFRAVPCDERDNMASNFGNNDGVSFFGLNKEERMGIVCPFFGGDLCRDYASLYIKKSTTWNVIESEKSLHISIGTFTPDELKTAGKLEIKLGHMKDGQFVE